MRSLSWKDLGAAFSLSNLFFIISWKELVYPGMHHYLRPEKPPLLEYVAIFANVLVITLMLLGLISLAKTSRIWLAPGAQLLFLGLGIVAFGPLSYELVTVLSPDTARFIDYYVPVIVSICCLLFAVREGFALRSITKNLKVVALFLLPFSFLILIEGGRYQILTDPAEFMPRSIRADVASGQEVVAARKVIWVIFDELDFGYLSAAAKNGTDLSDIVRLSNESFVSLNAHAPNNRTQDSIPSLLTGQPLKEAIPVSTDDVRLLDETGSDVGTLQQRENVFSQLKGRNQRSGIVGWFHPYCRIFRDSVSRCYWSVTTPKCTTLMEFVNCQWSAFLRGFEHIPTATKFFDWLPGKNIELSGTNRMTQFERNKYLNDKANELISDRSIDFLFLHFSVPHTPFLARTQKPEDESPYSSLEIVNDTVRRLRNTLESTGQWDSVVLILSSDHIERAKNRNDFAFLPYNLRDKAYNDQRIPFIVKFPRQKSRIDYEPTFNTVITKQMVLDIVDGKIRDANDFVSWLDRLRQDEPDLVIRTNVGKKH